MKQDELGEAFKKRLEAVKREIELEIRKERDIQISELQRLAKLTEESFKAISYCMASVLYGVFKSDILKKDFITTLEKIVRKPPYYLTILYTLYEPSKKDEPLKYWHTFSEIEGSVETIHKKTLSEQYSKEDLLDKLCDLENDGVIKKDTLSQILDLNDIRCKSLVRSYNLKEDDILYRLTHDGQCLGCAIRTLDASIKFKEKARSWLGVEV